MLTADISLARRFVSDLDVGGEVLLCAISGAHMYGFPSPDSDLDLKGIFQAPTRGLLGLGPEHPGLERITEFEGVECDLSLHEIGQALRLLLQGNGNMIERVMSPLQLYSWPVVEELQTMAKGALSQVFARHYRGFFRGCVRELGDRREIKTLLYAYRVGLTGVHMFQNGQVETDLSVLAQIHDYPRVQQYIDRKAAGGEHERLEPGEVESHSETLASLGERLEKAIIRTVLPEEPANRDDVEAWLLDYRLSQLTNY